MSEPTDEMVDIAMNAVLGHARAAGAGCIPNKAAIRAMLFAVLPGVVAGERERAATIADAYSEIMGKLDLEDHAEAGRRVAGAIRDFERAPAAIQGDTHD